MKTAVRIILTFFTLVTCYFFVNLVCFSLILGAHKTTLISPVVSLLIAILVSFFLWKKTGSVSNSLASCILMGGIIVGAIGFVLGFFGPLIFTPDSNLGPLLGIFITGPFGFIAGLIGGGLYWTIKVKKR